MERDKRPVDYSKTECTHVLKYEDIKIAQQVMDLESACRREDEQEAGRLLAELEHSLPQVFTHLAQFH